ncbi:MAG: ROK family protein [bacterium]|nr:ROK family protein [bacterium]
MMLLIDFGATYVKFALYNKKILKINKIKTKDIETTLKEIKKIVGSVESVRCAFAGWIKDGIVVKAPNINLENYNIKRTIENIFYTKDVKVDNDANVQIIGIMNFELHNKYKNAILFTLGSGIGGGVFIDGKIYRGAGFAGEFGHIKVGGVERCGCGAQGCIEAYIGLKKILKLASSKGLKVKDTYQLYNLAKKGNNSALDIFKYYGSMLGVAVSSLINAFSPEVVIFGGGLAYTKEFFFKSLNESIEKNALFKVKLYFTKNTEKYTLLGASIL